MGIISASEALKIEFVVLYRKFFIIFPDPYVWGEGDEGSLKRTNLYVWG